MKHILFGSDTGKLKVALLFKDGGYFNKLKLAANYIYPMKSISPENFIAFNLEYQTVKKCSATFAKNYLNELLPEIDKLGIKTLFVCDSIYFKYLTKNAKADSFYGYICPCKIDGYTHMNVILAPNYGAVIYNPAIQIKIDYAIETLEKYLLGTYRVPGKDVIHYENYPETLADIQIQLSKLQKYPKLVCDIETLGLDFWNCGLSTVAFAWNKHEGIAFALDRGEHAVEARKLLKDFLITYKGTLIFHNAGFDGKVLTYELWMKHLADYKGMLDGIFTITKNFEDTKLITYVATNNAVKNVLGLKPLAAEYIGNYAQENITDTSKIPLPDLLKYNLEDCLATWYVYEKYKPVMIEDNQEVLYVDLLKPTVRTLMQMELCGMPINPEKVKDAKQQLTALADGYNRFFEKSSIIQDFNYNRLIKKAEKFTEKAVKKVYTVDDPVIKEDFNPNSGPQIQALLHDYLGFPVIALTKTKQPSTKNADLKNLLNHTENVAYKEVIQNLMDLADVSIILSTFITAFERAQQLPDGSWRLYGNFNLGGTQSLRLSSSNPNLQNLPSSSKFAKIVKACFEPPKNWLFSGSDFDALEDKMGALLSRDPNKIKVYTDGFDGHCLRAYSYFGNKMVGIVESVISINSIEKKYPKERQDSKSPTFALSYFGTYITLMKNCGFSEQKAKAIEAKYHELYKVADAWLAGLIENARKIGYIPLAFGGRIRTPILAKSAGKSRLSYSAQTEARSAGNAATQSYCVLTLRALNEFMERVWKSKYKYDILPAGTIHDANYFMSKNNVGCAKWLNDNLIDCMSWQQLPEIMHPTIRISSSLEIYRPSWNQKVKIPNGVSTKQLFTICRGAKAA